MAFVETQSGVCSPNERGLPNRGTHAPDNAVTKNRHHEDLHTPRPQSCRAANGATPLPASHPAVSRILWQLINYMEAYDPAVWAAAEEKLRQKKTKRLQQNAAALGFTLLSTS